MKKMANMKNFKFKDYNIIAKKEGKVYAFLAKYKGRNIVYKTTDATLYEDVDGNERRSHAARAFVYEKIKSVYYGNVNNDIIVGATYECVKDVVMIVPEGELAYKKGEKYRSDQSGCITDEQGSVNHYWDSVEEFNEYFKMVKNG
jgi:hypothetical protein